MYNLPVDLRPETFLKKANLLTLEGVGGLKGEIINGLHGPLQYRAPTSAKSWQGQEHTGLNERELLAAFKIICIALDAGYTNHNRAPLLGAQDWATMSSTALAAIGRGYACTYTKDREDLLDSIWKGT